MKPILVTFTLSIPLFFTGCRSYQPLPREIIILPDLSASIDKESQQQMFTGIRDAALHLRRGDSLTIIPIMGDAEADLQGKILRYEVPRIEKREAYDGDLRKLGAQVANDLSRMSADAVSRPGSHTDILGSLRVALRMFSVEQTDKRLIILSDFIQDDARFRFTTDRRLRSKESAMSLACELRKEIVIPTGIKVRMGRLRSNDFNRLLVRKRLAIDAFWSRLLSPTLIEPDGVFALHRKVM